MRRNIIFILLMAIAAISFGQTATTKGHYNAHRGDSIGTNRTTKDKAIMDCHGLSLTNVNNEEIYFTYPEKVVIDFPIVKPPIVESNFSINSITEKEITQSSITIDVLFNKSDLVSVYIRFRKLGGIWQRTNQDPNGVYWIGLLEAATEYEYMIYAQDSNGVKINSDLLIFKTL